MTDRLKGLIVSFASNVREDDAEEMIKAILMIKGVTDVSPLVANPGDWIVADRVRRQLSGKLSEVLK